MLWLQVRHHITIKGTKLHPRIVVNKTVVTSIPSSNDYKNSTVSTEHVQFNAGYKVMGRKINSIYSFFFASVVLVVLLQIVVTA